MTCVGGFAADKEGRRKLPVQPLRVYLGGYMFKHRLETVELAGRVGVDARILRRVMGEGSFISLDLADRILCGLDMPHLLAELWPALYDPECDNTDVEIIACRGCGTNLPIDKFLHQGVTPTGAPRFLYGLCGVCHLKNPKCAAPFNRRHIFQFEVSPLREYIKKLPEFRKKSYRDLASYLGVHTGEMARLMNSKGRVEFKTVFKILGRVNGIDAMSTIWPDRREELANMVINDNA